MARLLNQYDVAIVLPETDWSYDHEHSQLEEDFAKISAQARADEFRKMSKALSVSSPFDTLLDFILIRFHISETSRE